MTLTAESVREQNAPESLHTSTGETTVVELVERKKVYTEWNTALLEDSGPVTIEDNGSSQDTPNGGTDDEKEEDKDNYHIETKKDDANDRKWNLGKIRATAGKIVGNSHFQTFIVLLILVNAIMMGVATFSFVEDNPDLSARFEWTDKAFLIIFTLELSLQFTYHGFYLFTDGWLIFDFVIVLMSWSLESLQIVRTFRIFRALRLVTRVKVLKDLVSALLSVGPRMTAITCLLLLVIYIYGVMCTVLFKDLHKNGLTDYDYFSRLDLTMWNLLIIMTLDWTHIARQVMHVYPLAWLVFVPYVMITSFIAYNLIVAVVCDSVAVIEQQAHEAEEELKENHSVKINTLRKKVRDLNEQNNQVLNGLRFALDQMGLEEPTQRPPASSVTTSDTTRMA